MVYCSLLLLRPALLIPSQHYLHLHLVAYIFSPLLSPSPRCSHHCAPLLASAHTFTPLLTTADTLFSGGNREKGVVGTVTVSGLCIRFCHSFNEGNTVMEPGFESKHSLKAAGLCRYSATKVQSTAATAHVLLLADSLPFSAATAHVLLLADRI